MSKEKTGAVQSVDRLFTIMEELSLHPRGMLLTDLANAVDLTPSTTHRFLGTLIAHHYAQKDTESGKYRLTMRMYEVGARVLPGLNILSLARPHLENLSEEVEEVVHLVVRDDDEVLYLSRLDGSPGVVNMGSYAGLRNPMYCTGVGKSILAYLPEQEMRQIWARTEIIRFTDNTITTLESMRREAAKIRQQGWAIDDEEHELGIRCVAAPIFDFEGKPVAAISVSGTLGRMDAEKIQRIAPRVMQVAQRISGLLGA